MGNKDPLLGLGSPRVPTCLLCLQHRSGHNKDGSGSEVSGQTLAGKPNSPSWKAAGAAEKPPLGNRAKLELESWPCDLLTKRPRRNPIPARGQCLKCNSGVILLLSHGAALKMGRDSTHCVQGKDRHAVALGSAPWPTLNPEFEEQTELSLGSGWAGIQL